MDDTHVSDPHRPAIAILLRLVPFVRPSDTALNFWFSWSTSWADLLLEFRGRDHPLSRRLGWLGWFRCLRSGLLRRHEHSTCLIEQ